MDIIHNAIIGAHVLVMLCLLYMSVCLYDESCSICYNLACSIHYSVICGRSCRRFIIWNMYVV